ncbi:MAG: hypothetical protein HOP31_15715 [Ignavibacteria bacterium]|nr:hypothetical protein [Ignavibacteria bacterium]
MVLKKILEILRTFDKTELKKFERFIRSDYYNTNTRVHKLFRHLNKFYPLFNEKKLTEEYLFSQVYPGKKYNKKTLWYLLSELQHLAEKYLSLSDLEEDEIEMKKRLVEMLIVKKLFSQALSHLKANDKNFSREFLISGPAINQRYDNSTAWHQLYFFSGKQDPLLDRRIQQGEYIVFNSIIEICHTYQNLMTLRSEYNTELDDNILFAFLDNIDFESIHRKLKVMENNPSNSKNKLMLTKAFRIYICFMISFMDEKDEKYFYEMKEMVSLHNSLFSRDELQNLHVMLLNLCRIKRNKTDDLKYLNFQFEIMKSALSLNLYSSSFKGQYMQIISFEKIFDTAFALKQFSWAEDFINNYKKELPPEFSEDVFNHSSAMLNFQNDQYEKALEFLSKIKSFKYFHLKTKTKDLTLMVYYELGYIEEALALISSYSNFLSKNKRLAHKLKESELNFVNFVKEIIRVSESPGKVDCKYLTGKINKSINLNHKDWLSQKVSELYKKKTK